MKRTWVLACSAMLFACSSSSTAPGRPGSGAGGGNGGDGGASGSAGQPVGGGGSSSGLGGSSTFHTSDASGGGDGMATCAEEVHSAESLQVDMYIMFDQSTSMNCVLDSNMDTRWALTSAALTNFINSPGAAGIGVGIQYFPINNNSCTVSDYTTPDVEIAPLPGNAQALINSIMANGPSSATAAAINFTPTLPAVQGAIEHAQAWKMAHPDHVVIDVLITDGVPDWCNMSMTPVNGSHRRPRGGRLRNAQHPTYVIGILDNGMACLVDVNKPNQTDLDSMAMSGGTDAALIVQAAADAATQFLAAITNIQNKTVLPCEYSIPPPQDMMPIDFNKVNVTYTPGPNAPNAGQKQDVLQAPERERLRSDQPAAGTTTIPRAPRRSSSAIRDVQRRCRRDTGGSVSVVLGCVTKRVPVK